MRSVYTIGPVVLLAAFLVWLYRGNDAVQEKEAAPDPPKAPTAAAAAVPASTLEAMQAVAAAPVAAPVAEPVDEPAEEKPADHSFSGGARDIGAGDRQQGTGPARTHRGRVPELSLDLGGHAAEKVAAHYGLVLAAHSRAAGALLGVFSDGRLVPLKQDELARFAGRGRSAAGVRDGYEKMAAAARQSGRDFDDIGLLYLVPRALDRDWTRWQQDVVARAGYAPGQVRVVRARYGTGMRLEARELELRDGRVVRLGADG